MGDREALELEPGGDATMRWRMLDELVLVAHSTEPPAEGTFERLLMDVHGQLDLDRWLERGVRVLVWSPGPGPGATNRKATVELFERLESLEMPPRVAVCSDSMVSRGISTALGWLGAPLRHFRESELQDALHYLGLDRDDAPRMRNLIQGLQLELVSGGRGHRG